MTFRKYLEQVYADHGDSTEILKDFAKRILGSTDPIHQTAVCRFFTSAVARAYSLKTGKADAVLILQGPQAIGKTSFFRILGSPAPEWFDNEDGLLEWGGLGGSTNQAESLIESTGTRRIRVVPITKKIDLKTLEAERDAIWAAAVSMYKAKTEAA